MSTTQRTLLLAPPSIASHEATLQSIYASGAADKATSDLTMLDRLSSGLVTLPQSTYDLVLVLVGADDDNGTNAAREEAVRILTRRVYDAVAGAMKPGAVLRALEGCSPPLPEAEAILAGLVPRGGGGGEFVKAEEEAPVLLRFGGKNKNKKENGFGVNGFGNGNGNTNGNGNGNGSVPLAKKPQPAAISLVLEDDLDGLDGGDDDDDGFIDESTLLTTEDINQTLKPPAECIPKLGKRRRACKDCTCGLATRLAAEDAARRAKADSDLDILRLETADDDLELDFTVKGKVGSCGSCSLGDAFRCADCPYMGLPAFKPGEEVTIMNNVAQL